MIFPILYVVISATILGYQTVRHPYDDPWFAALAWPVLPFVILGIWLEGKVNK